MICQCVVIGGNAGKVRSKCLHCGTVYVTRSAKVVASCRNTKLRIRPTLTDYNLRNNERCEVRIFRPPCVHLGERLPDEKMAKTKCKTTTFTPVYRCEMHRLCTPFDQNIDRDLLHPCYNCEDFRSQP